MSCITFLFLPHFDDICDLLLYRRRKRKKEMYTYPLNYYASRKKQTSCKNIWWVFYWSGSVCLGKKSALGLKCFPRPKAGGSNQGLRSNFFPIQTYLNYHFKDAMTIIQQFPPHQHTHPLLSLNFCDRVWWDGTWWRVALMRNISVKQRYPGSVSTASLHICHLLFFCILVWCGVAWVSSSLDQE